MCVALDSDAVAGLAALSGLKDRLLSLDLFLTNCISLNPEDISAILIQINALTNLRALHLSLTGKYSQSQEIYIIRLQDELHHDREFRTQKSPKALRSKALSQ